MKAPKFIKYEMDSYLLIGRNLIEDIRTPKLVALIYSWLTGCRHLLSDLVSYRSSVKAYLKYNNQIIILEMMLNDLYDPALRKIKCMSYSFLVGYPIEEAHALVGYPGEDYYAKVGYPEETGADGVIFLPSRLGAIEEEVLALVYDYAFFGVNIIIKRTAD